MRRIIVTTIFALFAIAFGARAQSTWNRPWAGSSHSYMAAVTDPENDNPVRWFVATNPTGTIKAVYNTDYTFITNGYNMVNEQLEDTAVYIVEIEWGAEIPDQTNFYIVFEVDDNASKCTNRMALPVRVRADFNALVIDNVIDPSCPDDVVNPLWNGSNQTDIGNTELVFQIRRQNSMLDWQFEFDITEATAQTFQIDSIKFVDGLSNKLVVTGQSADLTGGVVGVNRTEGLVFSYVYIRNRMGITLHLNFDLKTNHNLTRDNSDNLDAILTDNNADHTIQSMPVITNFSGN